MELDALDYSIEQDGRVRLSEQPYLQVRMTLPIRMQHVLTCIQSQAGPKMLPDDRLRIICIAY